MHVQLTQACDFAAIVCNRLARLFGNARPWPLDHKRRFGMLFKIGTLEDTKDRAWCWVLSAPIELLRAAGVAFDPNAKDMKSLQGESGGADSALRVHLFLTHSTIVPFICSSVCFAHVWLSVLGRHF